VRYCLNGRLCGDGRARTVGYKDSDMKMLGNTYDASLISASPRSSVVDGYVITERNIDKSETVQVNLFR